MSGEAWWQGTWGPWLAVLLVGFLPNELWRALAVVLARRLDVTSPAFRLVRLVAVALVAGVATRIAFAPTGSLGATPGAVRLAAVLASLGAVLALRGRVVAAVLVGEACLFAGLWLAGH